MKKWRASGERSAGCGGDIEDGETRVMTSYYGKCRVCGGRVLPGDWVYWEPDLKKIRHAPSGYKE